MKIILSFTLLILLFSCSKEEKAPDEQLDALLVVHHLNSTSETVLTWGQEKTRSFSKNIDDKTFSASVKVKHLKRENNIDIFQIKYSENRGNESSQAVKYEGKKLSVFKNDSLEIILKPSEQE